MKKQIVAILLALLFVGLSACGMDGEKETVLETTIVNTELPTSPIRETTEPTVAVTETTAAVDESTVVIETSPTETVPIPEETLPETKPSDKKPTTEENASSKPTEPPTTESTPPKSTEPPTTESAPPATNPASPPATESNGVVMGYYYCNACDDWWGESFDPDGTHNGFPVPACHSCNSRDHVIESEYSEPPTDPTEPPICAPDEHIGVEDPENSQMPTCWSMGYIRYVCSACGVQWEEDLDVLPHNFSEWIVDKEPTCTEDGQESKTCQYDGCGYTEYRPIRAYLHSFSQTIVEPTTDSEGYTLHTCSTCSYSYKNDFTAKLPSATESVPPTTTEPEPLPETTAPIEQPLTVKVNIGLEIYANSEGSGSRIIVRASASGGSGSYEYFIKVYRNGEYIGEQHSNAVNISPALSGTYTAEVCVTDTNGNTVTITKSSDISVG